MDRGAGQSYSPWGPREMDTTEDTDVSLRKRRGAGDEVNHW